MQIRKKTFQSALYTECSRLIVIVYIYLFAYLCTCESWYSFVQMSILEK